MIHLENRTKARTITFSQRESNRQLKNPSYDKAYLFLVPEYEITEPYQSNQDGEFVSHALHEQHKRDLHDGASFYKMDAFGNKMHLKLTRNTQMVKPGLELETRHENGDITRAPVKSNSLFHGKEISDPDSLVALSNDRGLVRSSFVVIAAILSLESM